MFHPKSEQSTITALLSFIIFCNALSQKISEVVSLGSFLSDVGSNQIILVWLADGFLLILITGLQSLLIDRFDRIKLTSGISLAFIAVFVLLRFLLFLKSPAWLSYSLLYLASQQEWLFFPLVFWVLANDLLSIEQTKSLFPKIASFSLMGNLIGIGITAIAPHFFNQWGIQTQELLIINIVLYGLIFIVLKWKFSQYKCPTFPRDATTIQQTLTEGWSFVSKVPLFRYLTLAVLSIVICETILDFCFFSISESIFNDAKKYQTFYSLYLLGRTVISMGIHRFLTESLIDLFTLRNIFILLPIAALAGSMSMLLYTNFLGSLIGIVFHKLPQYSFDETARKVLLGLVPEDRRGRVSILIDSYIVNAGGIIASLIIGIVTITKVWVSGLDNNFSIYLFLAVLFALISLWSALKLRNSYRFSVPEKYVSSKFLTR